MFINILTFSYKSDPQNQLERPYMMLKLWYMSIFIFIENTTDVLHLGTSNKTVGFKDIAIFIAKIIQEYW